MLSQKFCFRNETLLFSLTTLNLNITFYRIASQDFLVTPVRMANRQFVEFCF